jgi:hypothetical protein
MNFHCREFDKKRRILWIMLRCVNGMRADFANYSNDRRMSRLGNATAGDIGTSMAPTATKPAER